MLLITELIDGMRIFERITWITTNPKTGRVNVCGGIVIVAAADDCSIYITDLLPHEPPAAADKCSHLRDVLVTDDRGISFRTTM